MSFFHKLLRGESDREPFSTECRVLVTTGPSPALGYIRGTPVVWPEIRTVELDDRRYCQAIKLKDRETSLGPNGTVLRQTMGMTRPFLPETKQTCSNSTLHVYSVTDHITR